MKPSILKKVLNGDYVRHRDFDRYSRYDKKALINSNNEEVSLCCHTLHRPPTPELLDFLSQIKRGYLLHAGEDSLYQYFEPSGEIILDTHEGRYIKRLQTNDKVKVYILLQCSSCSSDSILIVTGRCAKKFAKDLGNLDELINNHIFWYMDFELEDLRDIASYLTKQYGLVIDNKDIEYWIH